LRKALPGTTIVLFKRKFQMLTAWWRPEQFHNRQVTAHFGQVLGIRQIRRRVRTISALITVTRSSRCTEELDELVYMLAAALHLNRQIESPLLHLQQKANYRSRIEWPFRQTGIARELDEIIDVHPKPPCELRRPRQTDERD